MFTCIMASAEGTLVSLFRELDEKPFSSLSYETKCAFKEKRFTPHLDVKIVDRKQNRKFQISWYKKYPWLAGCSVTNKLYCYTCILFGGAEYEQEWSSAAFGVSVTKNFDRRAERHQNTRKHIQNQESFQLLGRQRIERSITEEAIKPNATVEQNRFVIGRLVDLVCFWGQQDLALKRNFEDNNFELLALLSKQEQFIRYHLERTSGFEGTTSIIQKELIESVTDVINDHIKNELQACEFVGVQIDVTLDAYCKSQMSLLSILNKTKFLFLLCLYKEIFVYVDHLNAHLHHKISCDINVCIVGIKKTVKFLQDIRSERTVTSCIEGCKKLYTEISVSGCEFKCLKMLTYEILDKLILQMEMRFGDLQNIQFIELLDKNQFGNYKSSFPTMKLNCLLTTYPFFHKERLENELRNVYVDKNKYLPPVDLLKFIIDNDLQNIYNEVTRLIKLFLTYPVTPASSDSMNTLAKIKHYLCSSMANFRLGSLCTIAIEKNLVKELTSDQKFKDKVIDKFSTKKNQLVDKKFSLRQSF
ncbi:hypothetical protein C0J52_26247 [Blattella germanica]|nr:hypothetical protein C0J52_26247 [Blattella germanica]